MRQKLTVVAGDLGGASGSIVIEVTVRDDALVGGLAGGGDNGALAVGRGVQVQVGETVLVERSGGRGGDGDGGGGARGGHSGGGGAGEHRCSVDRALVPLVGLLKQDTQNNSVSRKANEPCI